MAEGCPVGHGVVGENVGGLVVGGAVGGLVVGGAVGGLVVGGKVGGFVLGGGAPSTLGIVKHKITKKQKMTQKDFIKRSKV
jgi:hypothetical protein